MEKLILKGKKEVKNLLTDSMHQTIQALGVTKASKKADKVVKRSVKKLAAVVAKQLKKERKNITKLMKDTEKKKEKVAMA
jgi:ABC-type glucose/galactose transport system permease subunit